MPMCAIVGLLSLPAIRVRHVARLPQSTWLARVGRAAITLQFLRIGDERRWSMATSASQRQGVIVMCVALTVGCSKPSERSTANEEAAVREVVTAYQAALKAR